MEGQLIDKDKKLKENVVQSHKQIDELEKEKQSAEARCKEYEERMKEMKFEIVGLQESNDSMGDIIDKFTASPSPIMRRGAITRAEMLSGNTWPSKS